MPKQLTWDDAEDIGILLSEAQSRTRPAHHPLYGPAQARDRTARLQGRTQRNPTRENWRPSRWLGTRSFSTAPKAETAARLNSYTPNNVHGQIVFLCLVSFTS